MAAFFIITLLLFPSFSLLSIYYSEGSEINHFIYTGVHQSDVYRFGET